MSVFFRTVGAWAELTADGAVAIPATPQTGDRMYMFARWKDFSVTATIADWTAVPGTPFADGSTTSGNGTGSVKVGCWYRDWQSGDTNPNIDFSANPENASVVIVVMAKEANDVWLTPVAVTAAMTNWTTSSQIVAASSTANVLGGGVVMGLIGIRDDTATMTRPSSGIDDSSAAITWNGNYVESPATHHSTTTGDDGAADLGYRLVSAGATATLRMTGTISAAETGAALWVVQGVEVNLVVQNSTHAHSSENPVVVQQHNLTPQNAEHSHTAENLSLTQVHAIGVQNASHNHAAENLTLTQINELAVQDSIHSHSAESLVLTQVNFLVVQDSIHSHTSESPTIGVVHELEIQNANHSHTSENIVLEQVHNLLVDDSFHAHFAQNLHFISIIFVDPGGDSVQAANYFHTQVPGSGGIITFDTSQKVNGIGSYKFDSDDGDSPHVTIAGVMGAARRGTVWFRYSSVPDAASAVTAVDIIGTEIYSDGGFDPGAGGLDSALSSDDEIYATATPAKNSGQGTVFGLWGLAGGSDLVPLDAAIKSVKIRYERKYDVDTSIGISRVKYRIDGVEGPNHDNTAQPLTDTVVEVDVTGDRESWARSELADGVFEVIAEARRGDTDTEHTQSWDYIEVEVEYFIPFTILGPSGDGLAFEFALIPRGDRVTLRLIDGDKVWYDGITELLPDTDHRISWGHLLHDTNLVDIKLYVDSIEELNIVDAKCAGGASNLVNLLHGWMANVGENKVCWFDQLFIDDGDDLTDCGNMLSTAKLPATVNEDNWDTTGGTGAVNERPLSETNYKEHNAPIDSQFQTYNLQAASAGDIDISGESLVGYMGWAWAQKGGTPDTIHLITNGVAVDRRLQLVSTPRLIRQVATSQSYPGNARGIGMYVETEFGNVTMLEGGVVEAYEGPTNPDVLLPRQELANETLDTIIDDLRTDPPDSYEICCDFPEFDGAVEIKIYVLYQEGGALQQLPTLSSKGRLRIDAGIEVRLDVTVLGATMLTIWRRLNVD